MCSRFNFPPSLLHFSLHHRVTREERFLLQKGRAEFYLINMSISDMLKNCFSLINKGKLLFIIHCKLIKDNDKHAATGANKVFENPFSLPSTPRFHDSVNH
jgi:hypothetical protein